MHLRTPRFRATFSVVTDDAVIPYVYTDEIPKELMDNFKNLIGDGQASVTVSSDLARKAFGSGAGAMVTVSLTCDQSGPGINAAVELAHQAAKFYALKFQDEAEQEFRNKLASQGKKVDF